MRYAVYGIMNHAGENMRVIAGTARRLLLETPAGMETRPTQDRIKETLFNIIQDEIYNSSFLDLFAGSGGIGIEALSRGAALCTFVDDSKKSVECIKRNLEHTHLADKGKVAAGDVYMTIGRLSGQRFDIIFMDPPYNNEYERRVLDALRCSDIADEDTLIIIEASLRTDFSYLLDDPDFKLIKEKEYKTNKHIFVEKRKNNV